MVSPNVDRVLVAVKALTPSERRQLRELMATFPEPAASAPDPDQILLGDTDLDDATDGQHQPAQGEDVQCDALPP